MTLPPEYPCDPSQLYHWTADTTPHALTNTEMTLGELIDGFDSAVYCWPCIAASCALYSALGIETHTLSYMSLSHPKSAVNPELL